MHFCGTIMLRFVRCVYLLGMYFLYARARNDKMITLDDVLASIIDTHSQIVQLESPNHKDSNLYDFYVIKYQLKYRESYDLVLRRVADVMNDIDLFNDSMSYTKQLNHSCSNVKLKDILKLIINSQDQEQSFTYNTLSHLKQTFDNNFNKNKIFVSNIPSQELCLGLLNKRFAPLITSDILNFDNYIFIGIKFNDEKKRDNNRRFIFAHSFDIVDILNTYNSLSIGQYKYYKAPETEFQYYDPEFYPGIYVLNKNHKRFFVNTIKNFLKPFDMDNCVYKTASNFYSLAILKDWTSKNESFISLSPSFDPSLLVSQFRIINYTHLWRPDRLNFFAYKERLDFDHWAVHFIFDNSYSLTQNYFQYFYIAKDDGNRLVLCNEPTKWSHLVEKSQNEVKRTINILLSTLCVDIYTYTDYLPQQQFILHKDIFPSFDNGIYAQQFYINADFLEYINLIYKVKETFERNNAVCTTVLYDYFFVKSVKREPSKTLESMKCFQHITKIETTVFFEFKEGYNGFLLQVNVDDRVYFVFFEYYSGFEHNFEQTFKNEAYEIETMHAIIDQAMDLTHYGNIREKLTRFMLRSIAELDMLRVITAYYNFTAAIETVIKLQNTLNWFSTDEKTITKRCVNEKSLKLIKQLGSSFSLCKQIDEFTNTILHLLFLYFQHVENHINTNISAGDKKTRYIFFQPAFYYHDDHIDIKSVVKTQVDNQVQLNIE